MNENSQTYRVENLDQEMPDLVAVSGEAPDGSMAEGYALAEDLWGFSPDHPQQPSNPEEAQEWQEERDRKYPHGWDVPIFLSDGITQIGTFHIG